MYAHDAQEYGWELERKGHSWERMVGGVQDHIASLNFGYRTALRDAKVEYYNAKGRFVDANTLEATKSNGQSIRITFDHAIIAVGGRPKFVLPFPLCFFCHTMHRYPGVPGDRECCITSDDLFSLPKAPGKTLVVGASYVALECAGFIKGLGHECTVMARSIFLRGFDQQCAEQVAEFMQAESKINFIRGAQPTRFEKTAEGKVRAFWSSGAAGAAESSDVFDTVLLAIGRTAITDGTNCEAIGVQLDRDSRKIICPAGMPLPGHSESTAVPNIFAIGDVVKGGLELTPVAVLAGKLLAQRLYDGSDKKMNYGAIATTVFTPIEYGFVGLSEEDAAAKYPDGIEVYHSYYDPLELTVAHRALGRCYVKVIVDPMDFDKVLGMHVVGFHAGEIIQGYALAFKKGITKGDLDMLVGIHPTSAETFTTLVVTKSSGVDPKATGC
jgi:thioredoxin/glutathione reductase (selenoprotein)